MGVVFDFEFKTNNISCCRTRIADERYGETAQCEAALTGVLMY